MFDNLDMRTVMTICPSLCVLMSLFVAAPGTGTAQAPVQAPVGESIVYKTVNGTRLSLYILKPDGAPTGMPRPTIVFFHGGGWVKGGVEAFNSQSQYLAAHGMIAVQVEYRLISGHDSPKVCVEDAKSAIRWLRSHAAQLNLDPNKIVEAGGSAGGYLAAFATMVPGWDDPQDDLSVSPKAELLILLNPVIDNGPSGYGYDRFGEEYKRYSPMFYVSGQTPPTLILSGSDDVLIKAAVLRDYAAQLKEAGVSCKLILYDGVGHGFFNREPYLTQTTQAMLRFLEEGGYLPKDPPR